MKKLYLFSEQDLTRRRPFTKNDFNIVKKYINQHLNFAKQAANDNFKMQGFYTLFKFCHEFNVFAEPSMEYAFAKLVRSDMDFKRMLKDGVIVEYKPNETLLTKSCFRLPEYLRPKDAI